jgi:acyl carrier protein
MNSASEVTLQEIFRAVFELSDDANVSDLRQGVTERWDSLAHIALVTGIESEFGITLDTADQLEMTSYDAIRQILSRLGV